MQDFQWDTCDARLCINRFAVKDPPIHIGYLHLHFAWRIRKYFIFDLAFAV